MAQRPVAIGLFLCEQVIIEERTRNVTPVNCFTHRGLARFPSERLPFVAFAVLTDGLGEMAFELVIQRLDTLAEVYRRSFTLRFANPLQEARCVLRIRDCSFPNAGLYQAMLIADGEPVAQRRFRLSLKESSS